MVVFLFKVSFEMYNATYQIQIKIKITSLFEQYLNDKESNAQFPDIEIKDHLTDCKV